MPNGPQGQNRPADSVSNAIRVAKILTDEVKQDIGDSGKDKAAQSLGRKGGAARREKLSPERRAEIPRKAVAALGQVASILFKSLPCSKHSHR
jgi:hypothetical protein